MQTTNIIWNENQTPVSIHFDDVYFSNDDAIAETRYVFIDSNQLSERFLLHEKPIYTIGETGFGSGLNFLIAWQQFILFRQQYPDHPLKTLQFVSVEKYPLSQTELITIHHAIIHDSNLQDLAVKLQKKWPSQSYQFPCVTLTVFFSDIKQFAQQLLSLGAIVDTWFFDGFSPSKNPDMWSADLFTELYNLTESNGSFATFTASGQVRRNLIQAGFQVSKRKGYGKKREMLVGTKQI